MNIIAFTDGSSIIKGDFYESSSAYIVTEDYKVVHIGGLYHENGTNSKGEVYAFKECIDYIFDNYDVNEIDKITIVSDSMYVVKSVNSWIYKWAKNDWKASNGEDIKFKDVFIYLYNNYLMRGKRNKKIKVYHIKSHIKHTQKTRREFQFINDIDISWHDYKLLAWFNDKVDKLANKIRDSKGQHNISNTDILEKENGRIIIKGRLI